MINGFYTDESGNNGLKDPSQPVLCYAGVLIPSSNYTNLTQQMQLVADKVLLNIQGKLSGVPKKAMYEMSFFKNFEIHARDFVTGEDFNSKIDAEGRFTIVAEILDFIKEVKVYAVVMDKQTYQSKTSQIDAYKMYELGYTRLFELVRQDLSDMNETCFVIADNGKSEEQGILSRVLQLQPIPVIYPDLQIQDSHKCNLVQVADLVTYLTSVVYRDKYGHPAGKYAGRIKEVYDKYLAGRIRVWEFK